jgi:hypothetical protein
MIEMMWTTSTPKKNAIATKISDSKYTSILKTLVSYSACGSSGIYKAVRQSVKIYQALHIMNHAIPRQARPTAGASQFGPLPIDAVSAHLDRAGQCRTRRD